MCILSFCSYSVCHNLGKIIKYPSGVLRKMKSKIQTRVRQGRYSENRQRGVLSFPTVVFGRQRVQCWQPNSPSRVNNAAILRPHMAAIFLASFSFRLLITYLVLTHLSKGLFRPFVLLCLLDFTSCYLWLLRTGFSIGLYIVKCTFMSMFKGCKGRLLVSAWPAVQCSPSVLENLVGLVECHYHLRFGIKHGQSRHNLSFILMKDEQDSKWHQRQQTYWELIHY